MAVCHPAVKSGKPTKAIVYVEIWCNNYFQLIQKPKNENNRQDAKSAKEGREEKDE